MTFASIWNGLPAWALVPVAFVLIVLALRYRGAVAIGLTAICLLGLWNAGDPHPWIALPIGLLFYGVLTAVAGAFSGALGMDDGGDANGYDPAAEQARLAADYYRRQREGRF